MSTTGFSPFGSIASPTNTTWNDFNFRALTFIANATSPRGALTPNFTIDPAAPIVAGAAAPAIVLVDPILPPIDGNQAVNGYNLSLHKFALEKFTAQDAAFSRIGDFLISPEQITDAVRKQLVTHLGGEAAMLQATSPEVYRALRTMFGTATAAALNSVYDTLATSTFIYTNQGSLQLFITNQEASFQFLASNAQAVNDARQIVLLEQAIARGSHREFFTRTITDFEQTHPLLDANRTYRALADQLIITNNLIATGHLRAMGATGPGPIIAAPEHNRSNAEAQIAALTKQLKTIKALQKAKAAGKSFAMAGTCTIHGPGHTDDQCYAQHPELRSTTSAPKAQRDACTVHGPGHSDANCYAQHPELRPAGTPRPHA